MDSHYVEDYEIDYHGVEDCVIGYPCEDYVTGYHDGEEEENAIVMVNCGQRKHIYP